MYYIEVILIWIVGGDKTCLPSTSYESVYIQLYFLHLLLRIYYEFWQNGQLPDQLLELYTGIAEVIGSNIVQA